MSRETRRDRSARRIESLRVQPAYERKVIPRNVPVATNPMEGLTAGAARIGSRMDALGRDLAAHFNSMASSTLHMADAEQAKEMAKIDQENQELQLQAALDHAKGVEYQSDRGAYTFARKRLEASEEIREISRKKAIASARSAAAARRKTANIKAAKASAERLTTLEKISRGEEVRDVITDANKSVIASIETIEATAKARAALEGIEMDDATLGGKIKAATSAILEATQDISDPVVRDSIISDSLKIVDKKIEDQAIKDAKATRERFQKNAEEAVAVRFNSGLVNTPEDVETIVGQMTAVHGMDSTAGRQAATKALLGAARIKVQEGELEAGTKVLSLLEPFAAENPLLFDNVSKDLRSEIKTARDNEVSNVANDLKAKLKMKDDFGAAWVFLSNIDKWGHPKFQEARREFLTATTKQAEERQRAKLYEQYRSGAPLEAGTDVSIIQKEADKVVTEMYQSGDLGGAVEEITRVNHVPKGFTSMLERSLTNVTLASEWTTVDDQGNPVAGPGMAFEKAFTAMRMMTPVQRAAISPEALAVFDATDTLARGGQSVQSAAQSVLKTLQQNPQALKDASRKGLDLSAMYPDKKTSEARETFRSEVRSAIEKRYDTFLGSVSVPRIDEIEQSVSHYLGIYSAVRGGAISSDAIETATASVLQNYIRVPVEAETGGLGYGYQIVKAHSNSKAAKAISDYWTAAGDAEDQFYTAAKTMVEEMPEIIGTTDAIKPSLAEAPLRDAIKGWTAVTGGDQYLGDLVTVTPGSKTSAEVTVLSEMDTTGVTEGVPSEITSETRHVEWPNDVKEFEKRINAMNTELSKTGFQWLKLNDDSIFPQYYLGFRPNISRPVADPGVLDTQATGEGIEDTITHSIRSAFDALKNYRDDMPSVSTDPAGYVAAFDGLPRRRGEIASEIIGNMTSDPNSLVPRSLGLTVSIPETFDTDEAMMEWLKDTVTTHTINSRAGRPRPTRNADMPDEYSMMQYVGSFYSNSGQLRKDPLRADASIVGAGVKFDEEWVQDFLREDAGMTPQDLRDVRDGIKELDERTLNRLNIAALNRAEDTLRSKIDSEVLAELPFDAYMVLVGLAHDDTSLIDKGITDALNKRDFQEVERQIREESLIPQENKRNRSAAMRRRAVEANWWSSILGM